MRPRLLVLTAVATAMTVLPTATASAAKSGRANASAHEIEQYWSPARMKAAKPKPMARPGGGGGSGSVEYQGTYPKEHGKVFFSEGSANYVCSGTAVSTASGKTIVWTAGHCVWDDAGGFVQNFAFVPAYRDNVRPYGTFGAQDVTGDALALHTSTSWAASGQEFGVDVGSVEVGPLNGLTGGLPITFAASTTGTPPTSGTYVAYGYPAQGKFNGQRLRTCTSGIVRTDATTTPDALGIGCDMTGGSSGGGWLVSGVLRSNTSYGYGTIKNVLFGPWIGPAARDVYLAAGGS